MEFNQNNVKLLNFTINQAVWPLTHSIQETDRIQQQKTTISVHEIKHKSKLTFE